MDKIKVMLVEDHVLVREGTRELLEREKDIEVIAEAGDGEEAVRMAQASCPDIVLMDMALPALNGLEATRAIKAANPEIAILVLTAYDDDEYVMAFLRAGAAGYLLKEASGGELVKAIRAIHAGESVLHPAVARKVIFDLAQRTVRRRADEQETRIPVQLTDQELGVLKLAGRWMTNREMARELAISDRAVQVHLINIFDKLGVGSRTEAVLYGLKKGWLP
jgi:DNA-binding NarL/FixJ family response regulator